MSVQVDTRAVVLVEGVSDQLAVEALAARRGRDLVAEGISVVSIGGAGNIARFLHLLGPQRLAVRLAGLYDAAEERDFRRGLERTGFGYNLTRADMEALGSTCASPTWRTRPCTRSRLNETARMCDTLATLAERPLSTVIERISRRPVVWA